MCVEEADYVEKMVVVGARLDLLADRGFLRPEEHLELPQIIAVDLIHVCFLAGFGEQSKRQRVALQCMQSPILFSRRATALVDSDGIVQGESIFRCAWHGHEGRVGFDKPLR
jgi:hypothetical protein